MNETEEREVVRVCACLGPEQCSDVDCPIVKEYQVKQEPTQ